MKSNDEKRKLIIVDYELGYRPFEIASRRLVSESVVYRTISKFLEQKRLEREGCEKREALIDELLSEVEVFCPNCTGKLMLIKANTYRCNDCQQVVDDYLQPTQRERINIILKKYAI